MVSKRQRESTTALTGVDREALPLAVLTVTINKKRLTPSLYRQLSEEEVIDEETGELRGIAVGWFNIHPKEGCPKVEHKHVLWGNGTHLRMATTVAQENDPRYEKREQMSLQLRRDIIHFLAMILTYIGQPYKLDVPTDNEQKLKITGYTLYIDNKVGTLLEQYQKAQEQLKEDKAALRSRAKQETTDTEDSHNVISVPSEEEITTAKKTLETLSEKGVVLTHPNLYEHEDELYTRVFGDYYDDRDWSIAARKMRGWKAYPSEAGNEQGKALIYWKKRKEQKIDASTVETFLKPHTLPLRILITERIIAEDKQKIQEAMLKLANNLDIATTLFKGRKRNTKGQVDITDLSALDPLTVWKLYEQEKKRFEAYTQAWDEHLEAINALEQLFLI